MTTTEASIQISEDGFFWPRERLEKDHTDPSKFRHVGIDGLVASVQFVRAAVLVHAGARETEHIVIWGHHPHMNDDAIASTASALLAAYPTAALSFVIACTLSDGDPIHIDTEAVCFSGVMTVSVVAAIAAAHCSGTLGSVDLVTVRSGEERYTAQMTFREREWRASVSHI